MNAAAAALVVLNGRQAFDPRASLFAHNEPGFWYDFSDLSSMYQDSAGTTPVTAVEQAVGLILDKSKGLVLSGELATNGSFATDSGWTKETGWTISGGKANKAAGVAGSLYQAASGIGFGDYCVITFTVSNRTAGSVIPYIRGTQSSVTASANGTYTAFARANTNSVYAINFYADASFDGSIDDVSVRKYAGNHAIQPTSASRPILRSRYNLLTYSEQFDNAAWTKTDATVVANAGVAPNGTTTADLIYPTTTGTIRGAYQGFTATADTYTATLYAKPSGMSFVRFVEFPGSSVAGTVDLTTGSVTNLLAGYTITATDVGNSWREIKVTAATTAGTRYLQFMVVDGINTSTATANGTNGVLFWGADVRRSNDTYLPYQRIAASTDYDTVGFPVYLAFDGSDDSLYTGGNVDFSATDKMTVWAGVTKLSDAAQAEVVELSSTVANNGTFSMSAPTGAAQNDFRFRSNGTALVSATSPSTYAAPTTCVLTGIGDISGDVTQLRIDGAVITTDNSDQGTGNYSAAVLNMGRRNNTSNPFNGRLYQLIGRGAATSAALITQAERWVAGKQGRAL